MNHGTPRSRLTVQGWFDLMVVAMIAIVLLCAVTGVTLLARTTDVSDKLADQIAPARTETARLQSAILDQENGVRGYVITGNPQFLEPYTQGVAAEQVQADRVAALVGDRRTQMADLAAVRAAAADWRREFAEPNIRNPRTPGTPTDPARAAQAKQMFDHIRSLFDTANAHLDQTRNDTRKELHRVETQRNWVFTAMLGAFLLTGVALAVLLRRTVGRPLHALRAASRRVAAGDFGHKIPAQGPPDIQEVSRDVEAMRKRVVETLDEARQHQTVLEKQTADLDAQTVELRRSNAELEQFAYVASHDLQEPLRKVASFCQLIEKRYSDKLDERGVQYISFAVDGAKRMQVLINDLLTYSRVGRHHDAREPVELDHTLDKAAGNLSVAVEESGTVVSRPGKLPEVTGDPTLLTMLWQNLLGNAIKFRHPERAPEVKVECVADDEEDEFWRFAVTDNGIGIPAEFADKVFIIFQRLHAREAYSGTGIGLAMCKKIVEHHGGRIWVDVEQTEGTRVCFTLPVADTADTAGEGAAE